MNKNFLTFNTATLVLIIIFSSNCEGVNPNSGEVSEDTSPEDDNGDDGNGDSDEDSGGDGDSDSDGDSDGDGDGDTDVDTDTDSDSDTEVCAENNFAVNPEIVDMLIVLDRSESMYGEQWTSMSQAISDVTTEMQSHINFGLVLFPSLLCFHELLNEHDTCTPPQSDEIPAVAIQADAAQVISQKIASVEPCGNTPTSATLESARTYLSSVDNAHSRYVLLATDGGPNCNAAAYEGIECTCTAASNQCNLYNRKQYCLDDTATIAAAAELKETGYPTYVLGVGDSIEWNEVMEEIAKAGGTEKYYPVTDQSELLDTLREITDGLVSCNFKVDWNSLPDDASTDKTKVNFYCKQSEQEKNKEENLIRLDDGCKAGSGWTWVDDSTALFCDDACTKLKSDSCQVVSATFGCDSIPIVIK